MEGHIAATVMASTPEMDGMAGDGIAMIGAIGNVIAAAAAATSTA